MTHPLEDFAEWVVSLDDIDPDSPGHKDRQTVTLTDIITRARQALNEDVWNGGEPISHEQLAAITYGGVGYDDEDPW